MQIPTRCPLYDSYRHCAEQKEPIENDFQLRRCQRSLSFDSYLECQVFSKWFWKGIQDRTGGVICNHITKTQVKK